MSEELELNIEPPADEAPTAADETVAADEAVAPADERPAEVSVGAPVEVMPLEAAEVAAEVSQQRRRRLKVWVAGATLAVGLVAGATQVRLGTGGGATHGSDELGWESGMRLMETGRRAEGIGMLEDAVNMAPQGAERTRLHLRLAGVYRTLGEQEVRYLNSAVRHYVAVLDSPEVVAPTDDVLYDTATCFVQLGSYESALESFQRIDAEFPESVHRPQAQFQIGECLVATGRHQEARQAFAEVAEAYRGEPLGEQAFFHFADSFNEQAQSLKKE
jgi:TolA-binding protein